jgi:excisionase family DNA binding protein
VSPVRAAQILGVPVADVYKLIDGGRLPGYRIADEVKLLAHDIEALLDDGGDDRPG